MTITEDLCVGCDACHGYCRYKEPVTSVVCDTCGSVIERTVYILPKYRKHCCGNIDCIEENFLSADTDICSECRENGLSIFETESGDLCYECLLKHLEKEDVNTVIEEESYGFVQCG